MKIIMFILMFLIIGALFIVGQYSLNITEQEDLKQLGAEYVAWVGRIFENTKDITSNVIKLEWLPDSEE